MDPSSVSVKDLIDERIKIREQQLVSEIDSEVESRRTKAFDNLQRRFSELPLGDKQSVESIPEVLRKKIHKLETAFDSLEASIQTFACRESPSGHNGISARIDEKLEEFKQDLSLFRTACKAELRRNINSHTDSGREYTPAECIKESAKTANKIFSEISQQTNMLRSQNLAFSDSIKTPDLTFVDNRIPLQSLGDVPAQIDSLFSALSRLSGASIQEIIDRSIAKMDEEYLSLISVISRRIFELKDGTAPPGPDDIKHILRILPLLLANQPVLTEQLVDAIEAFAEDTTTATKFIELFFRKVHRDRYR